jgi:hypothetical protein
MVPGQPVILPQFGIDGPDPPRLARAGCVVHRSSRPGNSQALAARRREDDRVALPKAGRSWAAGDAGYSLETFTAFGPFGPSSSS